MGRVLRGVSGGILSSTHAFSKRALSFFQKHTFQSMGTYNFRVIGGIFAENGLLEGGLKVSFKCIDCGDKGDFRWVFLASTHAFSKGALFIFQKPMRRGMSSEIVRMMGCIFAENGPVENG